MIKCFIFKGIQDRIVSGIDLAPFVFQCSKTGLRREVTESGTSLIKSLCKRSPTSRLGYQSNGVDGIRKHKWFKEVDWNGVLDQRIPGPVSIKLSTTDAYRLLDKS
jgi:hypothetical protein